MIVSRAFAALVRRELLRWSRSRVVIVTGLIQPFLYLLLFGQAFNLDKLIGQVPPDIISSYFLGAPDYYSYFAVGMVGFVVVFSSLFVGATVIFDQRLGVIKKSLAAPIRRTSIFSARLLGGLVQPALLAAVVFGVAILFAYIPGLSGLTVTANVTFLGVIEIALAILALAIMFSAIALGFGFVVTDPQSYFGLINLINLPILFTSNALFPRSTMPQWLQNISAYNPVTIGINVMRLNLFPSGQYYAYTAPVYLGVLVLVTLGIFALSFLLARRGLSAR